MDPNATTTAATTTGFPVPALQHQQQTPEQQHYGQQFPFHPGAFPQTKTPSQQQSFGAVPFSQPGGAGGAIMPAAGGFPQHSSGTFWDLPFCFPFSTVLSFFLFLSFSFFFFVSGRIWCQDVPCGWSGLIGNRTRHGAYWLHWVSFFPLVSRAQVFSTTALARILDLRVSKRITCRASVPFARL